MYVELGKIVGVWGVKGWVKLHSYTRNRIDIAEYQRWFLLAPRRASKIAADDNPDYQAVKVLSCRHQGQGIVAHLEEVVDRDQAAELNGYKIFIMADDLPNLPEGEFYWQQLIGLKVSNKEGAAPFATVQSILETGANDVLVCRGIENDKEEILIPYTDQTVLSVDLESASMLVDWDPQYLQD